MSDLPQFARFWMVCRKPNGAAPATTPQTRWRDKAIAQDAAQRLADANNHAFIVLEAVEIRHPAKPQAAEGTTP